MGKGGGAQTQKVYNIMTVAGGGMTRGGRIKTCSVLANDDLEGRAGKGSAVFPS